ncbi:uracil phosphoribosyltransferase-domain-containing protein [Apiospora marii]|uniref:Uracil phosphoribosyltransferase-domain-containing protein n=2 Tax=Apiospora marii TaxID=335849 RepID=A0ABR1R4Z1_9PEZI
MASYIPPSYSPLKPTVVGIYGISGCGKTHLVNELKSSHQLDAFRFYEGSEVLGSVVPGGLATFQQSNPSQKQEWRQVAINKIRMEFAAAKETAVVTGHSMFWSEVEESGECVFTEADANTFTHILYLEVRPEEIAQRRANDTQRKRSHASVNHLLKWQNADKEQLSKLCRAHGILFCAIAPRSTLVKDVVVLLQDFQVHNEHYNLSLAQQEMGNILTGMSKDLKTMVIFDADKTLTSQDTGSKFWEMASRSEDKSGTLKQLFSGPMQYSYTAFRQAALLYEQEAFESSEHRLKGLLEDVALRVMLRREFIDLLDLISTQDHVGAVIVTCGLRRIWEKVVRSHHLSDKVSVIGGGLIRDRYVITPETKASLVVRLRAVHGLYVWAFGDSPMDIPMFQQADQAVVVVGAPDLRSKSMEGALRNAIDNDGIRVKQLLLPSHVAPIVGIDQAPVMSLQRPGVWDSLTSATPFSSPGFQVFDATNTNAARLLMTPTRNANISGPALREAHEDIGRHLVTTILSDKLGLDEYSIQHVQGTRTVGYRIHAEARTTIVALMRGGEPMALG